MPGARPARGWVLVSACACLIAAGAACGSAFTADAVDGGSGGGDAGLDVARDAAPSGDAPVDGPGPGEGGGSDGQPVDDGGTDGHDGGTCGKADAGYEQCIYLHCECLYPGGANAFYAKEWACTCASASTCEPQCMPTTCGNGDPDAEVPLCGDCLVSQAAINTTPCYYETVCGANQACIDFANCATHCQ